MECEASAYPSIMDLVMYTYCIYNSMGVTGPNSRLSIWYGSCTGVMTHGRWACGWFAVLPNSWKTPPQTADGWMMDIQLFKTLLQFTFMHQHADWALPHGSRHQWHFDVWENWTSCLDFSFYRDQPKAHLRNDQAVQSASALQICQVGELSWHSAHSHGPTHICEQNVREISPMYA